MLLQARLSMYIARVKEKKPRAAGILLFFLSPIVADPAWPGLGALSHYGRAAGVNWVWAVELTIFHSLISIVVLSPLIQLDPHRANVQGMAIVGLGMAVFLALVRLLLQRRRVAK
jgi:hypothetical protein